MRTKLLLSRWAAPLLLCISASGQTPVGELFAADPRIPQAAQRAGTGMAVLPGSELAAGAAAATLKLARGGEVRLCSGTRLTVNTGGQGLLLGMDTGALEVNVRLQQAVTDLLLIPDFSIRLTGPAVYHFALGVNSGGDTCFKPLPGNTTPVSFSELLGNSTFSSSEAALFRAGKVGARASLNGACGCPEVMPFLSADAAPSPNPSSDADKTRVMAVSQDPPEPGALNRPEPAQVRVDTPFIFSARAGAAGPVAKVEFSTLPNTFFVQEEPDPVVLVVKPPEGPAQATGVAPAATTKGREKKGFLARVKRLFSSLLHH